jgi:hypothetical protein
VTRRVLVVGSGKRVVEAALPVFRRAEGFELEGVVSRRPKTIVSEGREVEVRGLETLTPERLSGVDLVYMVVAKGAVPSMLRRLAGVGVESVDLLIETPVLLVRHMGHRPLLDAFRAAWVSEDCLTLPCLDAARAHFESGASGALERVTFDRSAYAYHGIAMARAALGGGPIRRARQRRLSGGLRERRVVVGDGREATILDPRDYARGTMTFHGSTGTLTDRDEPGTARLEAVVEGGRCTALRAGDARRELSPAEVELMGERGEGVGVTAWMDGMKRVGFLKLVEAIGAGRGACPVGDAVEDSVVDYHLEKLGRYLSTPLTRPDAPLARLAFAALTRLTGGPPTTP